MDFEKERSTSFIQIQYKLISNISELLSHNLSQHIIHQNICIWNPLEIFNRLAHSHDVIYLITIP